MKRMVSLRLCGCLFFLGALHFTTTSAKGHGCSSCKVERPKRPINRTINPRECEKVTARVDRNLKRRFPCDDDEDNVGYVVVNPGPKNMTTCVAWSPVAYWDGYSCMGRCELLGGVEESYADCTLNRTRFNQPGLFVAPIKDGTWLGERDSAWSESWFNSTCAKILENRWDGAPVITSECNATRYTQWCSGSETQSALRVPPCRGSALGTCGVMVPCPKCAFPPFLFSEALYSAMGVHNCAWSLTRDVLMLCGWLILAGACCCACREHGAHPVHCCVFLAWAVVCVWEFALAACVLAFLVWGVLRCVGVTFPTAKPRSVQPEPAAPSSEAPKEEVVATRAYAVSEFRQPVNVAAVAIDFPIRKPVGWKHV
jgi:hypothetical protein